MVDTNDTNDTPHQTSALVRTGRDGRQRYSEQYRNQALEAFDASGMSAKAFADHCGVKYPTFASWLAKRRRRPADAPGSPAAGDTPAFLLAELGEAPGPNALEIALPGGVTARASTPAQVRLLASLIAALR